MNPVIMHHHSAKLLYRVTGYGSTWACRIATKLGNGTLYRFSCWLAGKHYDIAVANRFWKINPLWVPGSNDHPKFIDNDDVLKS